MLTPAGGVFPSGGLVALSNSGALAILRNRLEPVLVGVGKVSNDAEKALHVGSSSAHHKKCVPHFLSGV